MPRCDFKAEGSAQTPYKLGESSCYFFVKTCDGRVTSLNDPATCTWATRSRKIEMKSGLDRVSLPIVTAVFAVIPSGLMMFGTAIRSERTAFTVFEFTKLFAFFDLVMLCLSTRFVFEVSVIFFQLCFNSWHSHSLSASISVLFHQDRMAIAQTSPCCEGYSID